MHRLWTGSRSDHRLGTRESRCSNQGPAVWNKNGYRQRARYLPLADGEEGGGAESPRPPPVKMVN